MQGVPHFLILDSVSKTIEFIENPCKLLSENAGLEVVKIFKKHNIKRIVTTDVGYKIKSKLDEMKIQIIMISDNNKTMQDILDIMNFSDPDKSSNVKHKRISNEK